MKPFRKSRPKCKFCKKAMYPTQNEARYDMMRVISHNPNVNMFDLHTYPCPHKIDGKEYFHFGHVSYYEKSLQKQLITV